MGRTVLLVGATGLVGRALLQQLAEDPRVEKVVVLVRRPTEFANPKVDERVINFDELASLDLPPVEDVYCALGTTIKTAGSQEAFRLVDFTYPTELAKRALGVGAKRYLLVSALGATRRSNVFYSRTKGECEHAIRELGFASTFIFRPSLLTGAREVSRLGEAVGHVALTLASPVLLGSLRRYRAISGETVARAMVRSAFSADTGVQIIESERIQSIGSAA